ncbi:MAG: proline iminopeptidase, partial [Hyphomicrobiales bacterium]
LDDIRSLQPFKAGAEALARHAEHSPLYDLPRLAANDIPVAAVIYHDDMYVDAGLSLETAAKVGNLEYWITNEFEHDGIRQSSAVFKRLLAMVVERGGPIRPDAYAPS